MAKTPLSLTAGEKSSLTHQKELWLIPVQKANLGRLGDAANERVSS